MNSVLSIVIGFILILGVGGLVYWQAQDIPQPASTDTESIDEPTGGQPEQSGNTQGSEGITAAEVAQHSNSTSCWSIINGSVYDLTSWIPKHPGGPQAILKLCGVNGSEEFNEQHGGAALQLQVLAGFKIGVLAQ